MNEHDRAAFRAFVREHHPDRGGDPEVFVAGLARFGVREPPADPAPDPPPEPPRDDGRSEPPEAAAPLPFPVRVGVALIRTWRRRRNPRVE